jgi:thioredoxin 1
MASANVVKVLPAAANFDKEVVQSTIPVLLYFGAQWCGPCRMIAPVLDEVAEEKAGKLRVAKVDIDENNELALQYRVTTIPTMFVIKSGAVVEQMGPLGKKDLERKLAAHLG